LQLCLGKLWISQLVGSANVGFEKHFVMQHVLLVVPQNAFYATLHSNILQSYLRGYLLESLVTARMNIFIEILPQQLMDWIVLRQLVRVHFPAFG
jgi:hypothetical protein